MLRKKLDDISLKIKNEEGFTLIELIVVMAIITVLVLLAAPNFMGKIQEARVTGIQNDVAVAEGKVSENLTNHKWSEEEFERWDKVSKEYLTSSGKVYGKDGELSSPHEGLSSVTYRKIDDEFINKEVRSSLEGTFYTDDDGFVYYVVEDASGDSEGDTGESTDYAQEAKDLFVASEWVYDDFTYDGHILTGFSEHGIAKYNGGLKTISIPDIGGPDGEVITEIANEAFRGYVFTGDFNAPNVESIGNTAFFESKFSGVFNAPKVITIEHGAFRQSVFTGHFNAPNVESIGGSAFVYSKFSGEFNAPNVESIGYSAFPESGFAGEFNAPNVQSIGSTAFLKSDFSGDFNAPNVESIGYNAFVYSKFDGEFNAPNVITIEFHAFSGSKFSGEFKAPNIVSIGDNAFENSNFSGDFNAPNVESIGHNAFANPEFTNLP